MFSIDQSIEYSSWILKLHHVFISQLTVSTLVFTLQEGVLKFSKQNQNMPWRKILEFGCRVFDKTRTPVDLKDKWKKMSSKKGKLT